MRNIINNKVRKSQCDTQKTSNDNNDRLERFFSVSKLSARLSVSKGLIRDWIAKGLLEIVKIPGRRRILIPQSSINDLLDKNRMKKNKLDTQVDNIVQSIVNDSNYLTSKRKKR